MSLGSKHHKQPHNVRIGVNDAEIVLPKVPATACLTVSILFSRGPVRVRSSSQQLLWQFGDRHYIAQRWVEAADWFLCGTHPIFSSMARPSHAKCLRKAALCHIQQREYSKASAILRRCPGGDAATCYVSLLAAVHQGASQPLAPSPRI